MGNCRMKGFVPTPDGVVDLMVDKLFEGRPPAVNARLLDPGCGRGAFIAGVLRWCLRNDRPVPVVVGMESDPKHHEVAVARFAGEDRVQIRRTDFLTRIEDRYEYVIGNPPYVPITALSIEERNAYRRDFTSAQGRFDLYLLFFEQALRLLSPGGRLVFITPEKFLYVDTARALRSIMCRFHTEELHFLDEQTFDGLVTYPLVSTLTTTKATGPTRVIHRDGRRTVARLDAAAISWMPAVREAEEQGSGLTLADICTRVSCGVATGADSVYVMRSDSLESELRVQAYPTLSGRQLMVGKPVLVRDVMLMPYSTDGRLLPEKQLGPLGRFLAEPSRRSRLLARTCVARKPWYAFHETPPMPDLLQPKLLCKDITATPFFVLDRAGEIVPRHSVYYMVPATAGRLEEIGQYLNSPAAQGWLRDHCQRAANGFLRLQSHVLKRLPVPSEFEPARRTSSEPGLFEALSA